MHDEEEKKANFRVDGFSPDSQIHEVRDGMGGQIKNGINLIFGMTSAQKHKSEIHLLN